MIDINTLKNELSEYATDISIIRAMSAVSIDGIDNPDYYSLQLTDDYTEIGRLGKICRRILSETVYPVIRSKEHLSAEVISALQDFCDMLINPTSGDELDLFLLYDVSERLLIDLKYIGDDDKLANQLNTHVSVCYANVNRTARLTVSRDICTYYRDQGLIAAKYALEMLFDHDRYLKLSNDGRIYLLRIARFYSALYDTFFFEYDTNEKRFNALVNAINLCADPFYRDSVEGYNWKLHQIRCVEHMGQLTERGNRWGFTREQCRQIYEWIEHLIDVWESDYDTVSQIIPESHYELLILRNSYFAGYLDNSEYRSKLLSLYDKYSNENYDMYSAQMNLLIPLEYLAALKGVFISEETATNLRRLYDNVTDYILRSVNLDAFNFLQEYLIGFLEEFIEIPGVMSFMDIGLHCLAALHPPTYVHSLQVADISSCLLGHLINRLPDRVCKEQGIDPVELKGDVRSSMLSDIYKCALCHDFGKLSMIDSIFIYGRDLLDREYDIIHLHTKMGEEMLSKFFSTYRYAKSAGEHHLWYNGGGGYPIDKSDKPSLFSSIITIADSIDAANDNIGRSYRPGKSLPEIVRELKNESGTRYAPYITELLDDKEVMEDLSFILTEGRKTKYRNTYLLLSGLTSRRNSN